MGIEKKFRRLWLVLAIFPAPAAPVPRLRRWLAGAGRARVASTLYSRDNMKSYIGTILIALAVGVAAVPAARAEIVVVVNTKNPATRMFREQAAQFFLGKSTLFTPIDHADSAAIRGEFCKKVLEMDPSQVKAIWSKLLFTGRATAPRQYGSDADVKKAVAADVSAIGYIDKSAVDDTVKVILTVP